MTRDAQDAKETLDAISDEAAGGSIGLYVAIERAYALGAAAALERAAKVCEEHARACREFGNISRAHVGDLLADSIRALNTEGKP